MAELDNMKIDWVGALGRAEAEPARPFWQSLGPI